ncbi:MAG: hypothetical protein EF813_03100 [Methanosarcinales archaeon]|nr:MAG: hypothetical protein EF813_03100 [Methanosarcinales archaeon]
MCLHKTTSGNQKIIKSLQTYIGGDENPAFARIGFLVYDRVGYQRRAIIGHNGGINLVDRITNAIPDPADSA